MICRCPSLFPGAGGGQLPHHSCKGQERGRKVEEVAACYSKQEAIL